MKWESEHVKFINDYEYNSGGDSDSFVKTMNEWGIVSEDVMILQE